MRRTIRRLVAVVPLASPVMGGAYYSLGSVVMLAAERTHAISKNQVGDRVDDNSLALGASAGF